MDTTITTKRIAEDLQAALESVLQRIPLPEATATDAELSLFDRLVDQELIRRLRTKSECQRRSRVERIERHLNGALGDLGVIQEELCLMKAEL